MKRQKRQCHTFFLDSEKYHLVATKKITDFSPMLVDGHLAEFWVICCEMNLNWVNGCSSVYNGQIKPRLVTGWSCLFIRQRERQRYFFILIGLLNCLWCS